MENNHITTLYISFNVTRPHVKSLDVSLYNTRTARFFL